MTAVDIELLVARHFGWRQNLIVPNVSWGLFSYGREADMLIVRPSGWCVEVEIKVSSADIKRDKKKLHDHRGPLVRWCWFAVPEALKDHPDIPEHCGVLAVIEWHGDSWTARRLITTQAPTVNHDARKLTDAERLRLAHLGAMRIWSLKEALGSRKMKNGGAE